MQYGRKRKMVYTDVLGRIEREVIKECSPTLAGLKTGNLFNYRYDNISDFRRELASVNRKLNAKGVYVTFLKRNEKSALLYVFRPDRLEKDLSQPAVQNVLKAFGYTDYKVGASIKHLKQRVEENTCFPHEIGLFLSYPVEDVIQFIRQKGCNYKCCGVWKVYCDEAFSQKMFARYRKCTEVYLRVFDRGRSISALTV